MWYDKKCRTKAKKNASEKKSQKSFEKDLTNALKCGKINKSPNERKLPKATKDLEN